MMNVNGQEKERQLTMYTVEFESDAAVVVTMDQSQVNEDVEMVYSNNGMVYLRQYEEATDLYQLIYMSQQQWQDLMAGYQSPEGAYYLTEKKKGSREDGDRG